MAWLIWSSALLAVSPVNMKPRTRSLIESRAWVIFHVDFRIMHQGYYLLQVRLFCQEHQGQYKSETFFVKFSLNMPTGVKYKERGHLKRKKKSLWYKIYVINLSCLAQWNQSDYPQNHARQPCRRALTGNQCDWRDMNTSGCRSSMQIS